MLQKKIKTKYRYLPGILGLSAGVLLLIIGVIELHKFQPETAIALPVTESTMLASDTPSEANIDLSSNYNVPADEPRRIIIPSIQKEGFIQKVGINDKNEVATPSNINLAGWFVNSTRPGDRGVSLIAGHISGEHHPGIFNELSSLKAGETYRVEFGDQSFRTFEVISVAEYDVTTASEKMLVPHESIDNQLNLITCSGEYNEHSRQYQNRTIIISKRVG